jgi:DNA-binding NarL/FixJ family response regulator
MNVFIYDRSVYFSGSFISFLKETVDDIEISYFPSEEELEAAAVQQKPPLVILDVKYSGHLSFQLIRSLKNLYKPVVIVCMYILADELLKKQCTDHGADYVLDKYMEYERITEIINEIKSTGTA